MKISSLLSIEKEPVSHNAAILKQVFVRNGEIPHITCFTQSRFPVGESAAGHMHQDMYEVFLVESGTGVLLVNEKEVDFVKGSCVVVEPGEFHEIRNVGNEELVLTYFGIEI